MSFIDFPGGHLILCINSKNSAAANINTDIFLNETTLLFIIIYYTS